MPVETQQFDPDGDLILLLHGSGEEGNTEQYYFRVSSKHLMHASPVFKAMFSARFQEGEELRTRGIARIELPDDDAEAMSIILSILHNRTRDVAITLDWALLMEVATLVDKYELLRAVGIFADLWFDNMNLNIPGMENFTGDQERTVYQVLFLTWVFKRPKEFAEITMIAAMDSKDRLEDATDLPVPRSITCMFVYFLYTDAKLDCTN